ncbi:MAG: helix-turn-helix domain-containing protein [Mycetocola sp.]
MTLSPPSAAPRFLTVTDVAELLQLSSAEVVDLLAQGQLRGIQIGSPLKWRVEVDELAAYVDGQYEEARRRLLWQQVNLASVGDMDAARARRRPDIRPQQA